MHIWSSVEFMVCEYGKKKGVGESSHFFLCLIRVKEVWRSDFQSLYAHVMCAGALSRSKTGLHDL